jgi:hypothetical protein
LEDPFGGEKRKIFENKDRKNGTKNARADCNSEAGSGVK